MSSAPPTSAPGTNRAPDGTQPARPYTPGLSDGLGDRLMMFDNPTQSSVELLRFKREFSDAPGFEEALRDRVEELSGFKHPSVAAVRGVQMLDDGLALVSNNTAGRRLSEMVHVARGAPFAMDLIQQLAPALAALHQQGPRIAHGLLTAERIIITREGRLIVVEHVLASAFELLRLPASHLRSEFGIAVPANVDPVGLNQRSDVVQLGFVALSLLLGRRLDPAHYPANITTLLDEFAQADKASAARLRPWLERALQQGDRPFTTAQEAHTAFGQPAAEITRPQTGTPGRGTSASTTPGRGTTTATTPSQGTPHSVLAFRPQADIPKAERPFDPAEGEPKIELRVEPKDPTPVHRVLDPHIPPAVSSVALARPAGSKMTAVKWIAAVVVLTAAVVGGLYAAGVFSDFTTGPGPSSSATPSGSSSSVPVDVAPLNPTTPAPGSRTTEPTAVPPTSTSTPESKSPIPPATGAGPIAPVSTTTTPATTPGTTGSAAGAATAAAGLAAAGTKPGSAPGDRPLSASGGFGGVKVTSAIELQVLENGTVVGSTAGSIAVTEGSHTFELVNESLGFRVRSTVNVRAGQMTPVVIALPNGRLSINAVPWADVFIDAKPVGQTPLSNLSVPIGEHKILFKHPDLGEQTQTVLVKADGLTRVSATFKQP